MVGSASCNLYGMSDDERVRHGEDPYDPGGYFIVNGTERVLMTLEDLASNKIMTEFTERYNERIYVAKVFSQYRGYRALGRRGAEQEKPAGSVVPVGGRPPEIHGPHESARDGQRPRCRQCCLDR